MADPPADPERFEEAIAAFRKRVPMLRGEWDRLTQAEREHAFMVSQAATADVVAQVYAAIDKAIATGTTFDEFKADVKASLERSWGGPKPGRLETIFRTNVQTAYNGGRHAVFSAPAVKQARPYLRFDGVEDDRQTDICAACNDVILPADDPFWLSHTPPLHFNCRSTVVALSVDEAKDEGIDDKAPDADPDDGFGTPPSSEGVDWEPDPSAYPEPIAEVLKARLAAAPPAPPPEPEVPETPEHDPSYVRLDEVPAVTMAAPKTRPAWQKGEAVKKTKTKSAAEQAKRDREALVDFYRFKNADAFRLAVANLQENLGTTGLGVPDGVGIDFTLEGKGINGQYNWSGVTMNGARGLALRQALESGKVENKSQLGALKTLLHEYMHAATHPRTREIYGASDAAMALEEATTEILAQHHTVEWSEKHLGLKVERHMADLTRSVESPVFKAIDLSQPGQSPRWAVEIDAPSVSYQGFVSGLANLIAHVDELDLKALSPRALTEHIAARCLQLKKLAPGRSATRVDAERDHRYGALARTLLDRAGVGKQHPRYEEIGRMLKEALGDYVQQRGAFRVVADRNRTLDDVLTRLVEGGEYNAQ